MLKVYNLTLITRELVYNMWQSFELLYNDYKSH